ncbi:Putative tail fiber assembly [Salmonella enterica subsp. enterica serovar Typhi]|nr:Putative tail fiber assembly [Salmonella enterica subsp. enterica serovar Typhi]
MIWQPEFTDKTLSRKPGAVQWPGKAAIGRLKGEELAQYNLWLDYLDALELVDTSGAPDIEWPTPPAVQAR